MCGGHKKSAAKKIAYMQKFKNVLHRFSIVVNGCNALQNACTQYDVEDANVHTKMAFHGFDAIAGTV